MDSSQIVNKRLRNTRILVVDDAIDQLELIQLALKQVFPQAQASLFSQGQQALTYLTEALQNRTGLPHIILLDLLQPTKQEGWQLLASIRQLPGPISRIPVIILSHSSDALHINESYDRGINAYVVKPFDFSTWLATLETLKEYWWHIVSTPDTRNR